MAWAMPIQIKILVRNRKFALQGRANWVFPQLPWKLSQTITKNTSVFQTRNRVPDLNWTLTVDVNHLNHHWYTFTELNWEDPLKGMKLYVYHHMFCLHFPRSDLKWCLGRNEWIFFFRNTIAPRIQDQDPNYQAWKKRKGCHHLGNKHCQAKWECLKGKTSIRNHLDGSNRTLLWFSSIAWG